MKNIRILHLLGTLFVLGFVSALYAQSPQNPFPINGPMIITAPGYYRLTRNIAVTATSGNIITVQAHNVTIDFNTFYIAGPNNPASSVIGVFANEFGNLTIKNGSIAFCDMGIWLTGNNDAATTRNINQVVENMRITNCYEYGVNMTSSCPGSIVSNCQLSQIGGSTKSDNGNVGFGVRADPGLLVKDNVISRVTGPAANQANGYGIANGIAVRNAISDARYGVNTGKYQNNLTSNVTNPFLSGVDAGGNN